MNAKERQFLDRMKAKCEASAKANDAKLEAIAMRWGNGVRWCVWESPVWLCKESTPDGVVIAKTTKSDAESEAWTASSYVPPEYQKRIAAVLAR